MIHNERVTVESVVHGVDVFEDFLVVFSVKGRQARYQNIKQDSQRPYIALLVIVFHNYFRSHVINGPDEFVGTRLQQLTSQV